MLGALSRLDRRHLTREPRRLHVAVLRLHHRERVLLVEVTRDHERRVVGRVVRRVEALAVRARRADDVRHRTDRRRTIGMHTERVPVEHLVRHAVHVVVDAHLALVDDDVLLVREDRVVEDEVLHAVGFDVHGELEALLRDVLVVLRPVDPRRGVGLRARTLEHTIERARGPLLRTAEHQVFEEVREPRLAGLLVARTDAIPRHEAHHGRRSLDERQHLEAIAHPVAARYERVAEGRRRFVREACVRTSRAARERARNRVARILRGHDHRGATLCAVGGGVKEMRRRGRRARSIRPAQQFERFAQVRALND